MDSETTEFWIQARKDAHVRLTIAAGSDEWESNIWKRNKDNIKRNVQRGIEPFNSQ